MEITEEELKKIKDDVESHTTLKFEGQIAAKDKQLEDALALNKELKGSLLAQIPVPLGY